MCRVQVLVSVREEKRGKIKEAHEKKAGKHTPQGTRAAFAPGIQEQKNARKMSEYNPYQCMESRHLTAVCLNTMCLIFILTGTDPGNMNFACILLAARLNFASRAFEGIGDEDPKITHHLSTDCQ